MKAGDLVVEKSTGRFGVLLGRPKGHIKTWKIKWLDNGKPPRTIDSHIRVIS